MHEIIKNISNFGTPNWIAAVTIIVNIIITLINNSKSNKADEKRRIFEDKIEHLKNDNAHNIQIQEYFKKIGTDKQSKILSDWTKFITDLEAFKKTFGDEEEFRKMKHDVIMYGSDTTVRILSNFLQFSYENEEALDDNLYEEIVYAAFIISSLKYDFSGYLVNPIDFLKLQMNDFSEHDDKIKMYIEKVKSDIGISLFGNLK